MLERICQTPRTASCEGLYIAAKERLRISEYSMAELDSPPSDWEAVVERMSDLRNLTKTLSQNPTM